MNERLLQTGNGEAPGSAEPAQQDSMLARLLPVASAIVSRLLVYILLMAAARLLTPDRFGVFAVLTTIAGVVNAIVSGGGDMWLNRFSRMPRLGGFAAPRLWPYYLIIVTFQVAVAILAAVAIAAFVDPLAAYRADIVLAVTAAAVAGTAEAVLAVIRASGLTGLFFKVRDLGAPILVLALLAIIRPDTESGIFAIVLSVWATVLAALVVFLFFNARILRPRAHLRLRALWRSLKHTVALVYGNLGSRLSIYIDVLALSSVVPLATVGEYRVAAQLAIGYAVTQHYMFLGLPWQLRHIGTRRNPGPGHGAVVWRQRTLIALAFVALLVLTFGGGVILQLFGSRFGSMLSVLQLLLVLRFSELLWGPQHEILVSNGRVLQDAHVNIAAVGIWVAAFAMTGTVASPIAAAVVAAVCTSLFAQGARRWLLNRVGLRPGSGHAFGPALPVTLALAVAIAALAP
ncbi:MAG TPA: oligosaccharide flippase family protein [Alphaproteobacteria bacterium]|nr:oligosaccharide flippase family protein [Alphaproteobacteria bacterium]